MNQATTQSVDGSRFTSWIVETRDPADMYKLTTKVGGKEGAENAPTAFPMPLKCPMTGMEIDMHDIPGMVVTKRRSSLQSITTSSFEEDISPRSVVRDNRQKGSCPYYKRQEIDRHSCSSTIHSPHPTGGDRKLAFGRSMSDAPPRDLERGGLSAAAIRTIFPYHVLIDVDVCIRPNEHGVGCESFKIKMLFWNALLIPCQAILFSRAPGSLRLVPMASMLCWSSAPTPRISMICAR